MSKQEIILIGGGGHCHSVIDAIEQQNIYKIAGVIDVPENIGKYVLDYKIIACDQELPDLIKKFKLAIVTVGHIQNNSLRVKLYQRVNALGYKLPAIISPLAYVSKYAQIGSGTVVLHHALVNANAEVGDNCIINSKVLIEHDAVIHDHCHVSTAAVVNGGVEVKAHSFIGSNATCVQNSVINGFIKAGSLIK